MSNEYKLDRGTRASFGNDDPRVAGVVAYQAEQQAERQAYHDMVAEITEQNRAALTPEQIKAQNDRQNALADADRQAAYAKEAVWSGDIRTRGTSLSAAIRAKSAVVLQDGMAADANGTR